MPDPELNEFERYCLAEHQPPALIQAIKSLKERLGLDLRPASAMIHRHAEALGLCTSEPCPMCAEAPTDEWHYGPNQPDGRPRPDCKEGRLYHWPVEQG